MKFQNSIIRLLTLILGLSLNIDCARNDKQKNRLKEYDIAEDLSLKDLEHLVALDSEYDDQDLDKIDYDDYNEDLDGDYHNEVLHHKKYHKVGRFLEQNPYERNHEAFHSILSRRNNKILHPYFKEERLAKEPYYNPQKLFNQPNKYNKFNKLGHSRIHQYHDNRAPSFHYDDDEDPQSLEKIKRVEGSLDSIPYPKYVTITLNLNELKGLNDSLSKSQNISLDDTEDSDQSPIKKVVNLGGSAPNLYAGSSSLVISNSNLTKAIENEILSMMKKLNISNQFDRNDSSLHVTSQLNYPLVTSLDKATQNDQPRPYDFDYHDEENPIPCQGCSKEELIGGAANLLGIHLKKGGTFDEFVKKLLAYAGNKETFELIRNELNKKKEESNQDSLLSEFFGGSGSLLEEVKQKQSDEVGQLKKRDTSLSCGKGWVNVKNTCLFLGPDTMSWDQAKDFCLQKKAFLIFAIEPREDKLFVDFLIASGYRNWWYGVRNIHRLKDEEDKISIYGPDNNDVFLNIPDVNQIPNESGHCLYHSKDTNTKHGVSRCGIHYGVVCRRQPVVSVYYSS